MTAEAGAASAPSTSELLKKLEQRDAVIEDLQQRVKQLEHQMTSGMPPQSSPPSTASAPPNAPEPPKPRQTAQAAPSGTAKKPGAGQFEVDEEAAERALERTLVISGAQLVPFGQFEAQPSFTYYRSELSSPTVLIAGKQNLIASDEARTDNFLGNVFTRFGLPLDSQLEVTVPYQGVNLEHRVKSGSSLFADTSVGSSGFGDVQVGLATSLLQEKHWWPNVIARLTWNSDTGETQRGIPLGTGFNELQGSVTVTKRQDPLVFLGSLSYQGAFEQNGITPGDQLGFSLGVLLAASPETSLRVILNQTFVDKLKLNGRTISGSDYNDSTLIFGASSIVGRGKFLDFTAGIGLTDGAPDYQVGVSFVMRFDVPFLAGL